MNVAGPISNPDEAHMLEQVAYLTDLRSRLAPSRGRRKTSPTTVAPPPTTPRPRHGPVGSF